MQLPSADWSAQQYVVRQGGFLCLLGALLICQSSHHSLPYRQSSAAQCSPSAVSSCRLNPYGYQEEKEQEYVDLAPQWQLPDGFESNLEKSVTQTFVKKHNQIISQLVLLCRRNPYGFEEEEEYEYMDLGPQWQLPDGFDSDLEKSVTQTFEDATDPSRWGHGGLPASSAADCTLHRCSTVAHRPVVLRCSPAWMAVAATPLPQMTGSCTHRAGANLGLPQLHLHYPSSTPS